VIVDAGHNPHSFANLVKNINKNYLAKKKVLILGLMRTKDLTGIVQRLKLFADIVITTNLKNSNAYTAAEIAQAFTKEKFPRVYSKPTLSRAYRLARKLADEQSLIIIAGSFHLAGEYYRWRKLPVRFLQR
jgi:dihydrofolate synthase / folylpolyglutamate synthase